MRGVSMDLDQDEQRLLDEFRALSPDGRQELLKLATLLLGNCLRQAGTKISGDDDDPNG